MNVSGEGGPYYVLSGTLNPAHSNTQPVCFFSRSVRLLVLIIQRSAACVFFLLYLF